MSKSLLSSTLLLAFWLCSLTAWAQRTVTGRVTSSEDGSGLPGVNVVLKGTTVGTATNIDGNYSLAVPDDPNVVIVFSSIGFKTQERAIGTSSGIDVILEIDVAKLDEAVVIGYGSVTKKDLTGSVATVSRKDFQQGLISTPEQLIAGKVAGVQITPSNGSPGGGATIRIRGGSSLRASNDPLYVIDGVPIDNNNVAGVANPLALINPNDIETFTVLKDASATAIYGSRASNGVIIITTRKGALNSKPSITFSTNNSVGIIARQVNSLSADQLRQIIRDSGTTAQQAFLGNANTDWQKQIYQKAFSSDNQLSIAGGFKKVPYRLSLGYLSQNGVLKTDNLSRASLGLQLNPSLFDGQLKINFNSKIARTRSRFADNGAIGSAITYNPTQSVYADSSNSANPDRFGGFFEWVVPNRAGPLPNPNSSRNPLGLLLQRENIFYSARTINNVQFDFASKYLPELRANLNLGYERSLAWGNNIVGDSASVNYLSGGKGGNYGRGRNENAMGLVEFYLAYNKEFTSIHSRFDIIAGHSYQQWDFKTTNYRTLNYKGDTIAGVPKPPFPQNTDLTRLESYYTRLNYAFKERYLFTYTIRSDASSRFSKNNRVGVFPSMALSWKANEESFLRNVKAISELKFRVGYGLTGQQDGIARYPYQFRYTLSDRGAQYPFGTQYTQMYRPVAVDPNLKWETTETYNAAMDFGFLDSRVYGSVDVYQRNTYNLLNDVQIAAGNFSDQVLTNVGSLTNRGVEIALGGRPVQTKDFTWDVMANLTLNRNEVTKLNIVDDSTNPGVPVGSIAGIDQRIQLYKVGYPLGSFYVFQQKYSDDGKPIEGEFVDQNGDGRITDLDKVIYKNTQPKFYYGISTNIAYKRFSLSAVFRGSVGNYMYNNVQSSTDNFNAATTQSTFVNNLTDYYLENRFTGRKNRTQQLLSDLYVQNASFFRCDNVSVSYNAGEIVPKRLVARVNFTVQNLFIISPYKGIDPEISGGIDNNFYPRPRTFVVGLTFDFK